MDATQIRQTFHEWGMQAPPIITYDQLEQFERCVYLYRGDTVGHWCCILFHPQTDSWEIFDPMGLFPDRPLDVPGIVRMPKKLWQMALDQDKAVEWNEFAHQGLGTATCGLWCIWRLLNGKLPFQQFRDKFSSMTDQEICALFNKPQLLRGYFCQIRCRWGGI